MEIDKLEYATQLKEKRDILIKAQRNLMNMKYQCVNTKGKATEAPFVCLDVGLPYNAIVCQVDPDEVLLIVEPLLSVANKKLEKIKDEINNLLGGITMDRLQEIMKVAETVPFSKNQASALVGGRRRLERLTAEKKISFVKTTDKKNGRWECKGSDVLRFAMPKQ